MFSGEKCRIEFRNCVVALLEPMETSLIGADSFGMVFFCKEVVR